MEDFPIMTPTRVGLPNSCSRCGKPVQEGHWMAEHSDAARSGNALCVRCYVEEKALFGLAKEVEEINLQPNELEQFLGQIPDEDLLVTGGAAAAADADTTVQPDGPVTGAAAEAENADTKPEKPAPAVITKPKNWRRKA